MATNGHKSFALPERYKGQEKQSVWLVIIVNCLLIIKLTLLIKTFMIFI